jgi:hypothetical protein
MWSITGKSANRLAAMKAEPLTLLGAKWLIGAKTPKCSGVIGITTFQNKTRHFCLVLVY